MAAVANNGQERGGGEPRSRRVGLLEVLPKELWPSIEENIEDPQDWLNFIRVSPILEDLARARKTDKLFPAVFLLLRAHLHSYDDMYNLRLVSRRWKLAVDKTHMSYPKGFVISQFPIIFLEDMEKVSRFTKEITGPLSDPFPFEIRAGIDITEPLHPWANQENVNVYWHAMARLVDNIGHRIKSLVLDVRCDPRFGLEFAEQVIRLIIGECLTKMPNLDYLLLHTRTENLELAVERYYKDNSTSNPIPSLEKLKTLELMTVGQKHVSPVKDYPNCFLRAHGATVKTLTVLANAYRWRNMDNFPIPNVEYLQYELHQCNGATCPKPEGNLLKKLPGVERSADQVDSLKSIALKLNWDWRPVDIRNFFRWLSANYGESALQEIVMKSIFYMTNPLANAGVQVPEIIREEDEANGENLEQHDHHNHQGQLHEGQDADNTQEGHEESDEDEDIPFSWDWLVNEDLKMPKIKSIAVIGEYKGSWIFLSCFRDSLEKLSILFEKYTDPKEAFQKGFLYKMFNDCGNGTGVGKCDDDKTALAKLTKEVTKDTLIWDYFPKLREILLVNRRMCHCHRFCYISRQEFLAYSKEEAAKKQKQSSRSRCSIQ